MGHINYLLTDVFFWTVPNFTSSGSLRLFREPHIWTVWSFMLNVLKRFLLFMRSGSHIWSYRAGSYSFEIFYLYADFLLKPSNVLRVEGSSAMSLWVTKPHIWPFVFSWNRVYTGKRTLLKLELMEIGLSQINCKSNSAVKLIFICTIPSTEDIWQP